MVTIRKLPATQRDLLAYINREVVPALRRLEVVASDFDASAILARLDALELDVDTIEAILALWQLAFASGVVTADRWASPPSEFSYASSVSLDVSQNSLFAMDDTMTGAMAIELENGVDGDQGEIWVAQDATGGRKITGITASGRTVLMWSNLGITLNVSRFLVSGSASAISYFFATIGGVAYVFVGVKAMRTPGYA